MCTWYVKSQRDVQPYWREAARQPALYVRLNTKADTSPHCCVSGPTSEVSDTEKISRTRSPVGVPSAEEEGNRISGQPLHLGKRSTCLHVGVCMRSRGWKAPRLHSGVAPGVLHPMHVIFPCCELHVGRQDSDHSPYSPYGVACLSDHSMGSRLISRQCSKQRDWCD